MVENWLVKKCPFSPSLLINESKLGIKLKRPPKTEGGGGVEWCMTCMANCSKTQWKKIESKNNHHWHELGNSPKK
jgi:hypothetical protein